MYKSLCIPVLLATFALTGRNSAASPISPDYPQIVAKARLMNQTSPIPTAAIYTPAQSGLFRLSVYASMTTPLNDSYDTWNYSVSWTDDSGEQSANLLLYANVIQSGQFVQFASTAAGPQSLAGPVLTFEAKAGVPITHTMTGTKDGSAYLLYYTLERLE